MEPCLVGIEACAGSHYWARELRKLGHTVGLMAATFVSAYRKSGKNDANDAEAICEAVGRPNMRFVGVKSEEQQSVLAVHRARELMVASRTAQANQIRGLLGEFGLVVPRGIRQLRASMPAVLEDAENGLPAIGRQTLSELLEQFHYFSERVDHYDQLIRHLAQHSEPAQRLMAVEGVGPVISTAVVASVGDATVFRNARQFAAWLGLTPRQHSSGGKSRLGAITKRGDPYLRKLLIHGARSMLKYVDRKKDTRSAWIRSVRQRRHVNIAAVALAAKHARIIWALLVRRTDYRAATEIA
jgi:transposase